MKVTFFYFTIVILLISNIVFALECGPQPTNGCTITKNTTFNHDTYYLPNGISISNSSVTLDCNGAVLLGYGSSHGIRVFEAQNNCTIKNCNIKNFSNGIYLYYTYYQNTRYQKQGKIIGNNFSNNSNGIYSEGKDSAYITNTNITGNLFYSNTNGIYLNGNVLNNTIYENTFQNNKNSGIYIDRLASMNAIWSNDFYGTGIYYRHTNNYFCKDGIANNYYFGADGPECNCYVVYESMEVNNYARLCPRTYNLSYNIFVYDSATLDCNNATLAGNGICSGIRVMQGQNNYTIKNCNIINFSNGIYLYYKYELERYQRGGIILNNILFNNTNGIYSEGISKGHITDTNIANNVIYGNGNGIHLNGNVLNSSIHGNLFFENREYNLRDNTKYDVFAEYNYWGTINISKISEKIYDYYDNSYQGIVYFEPFLSNFTDLFVSSRDIYFEKVSDGIRVNSIIHKEGYDSYNVTVSFFRLDSNRNLIESKDIVLPSFYDKKEASVKFNLKEMDFVLVNIKADPKEVNIFNNFAEKEYHEFPFIYVSSSLYPSVANNIVKEYIKSNLQEGYYTEDEDNADVFVYIGRKNEVTSQYNPMTLNNYGFGYMGNILVNGDKEIALPYSGLIANFFFDGKRYVFIYGSRVEGDIATIKRFINNGSRFINMEGSYLIDREDIDAIGVYDFMHNDENRAHYNKNTEEFGDIIQSALNDEMFTTEDKTTYADGVMLRLREIKPAYSEKYLEYKDEIGLPVVLARGLWGNLTTWSTFGGELANEGRDTWLIEITGGPGQDCDTCPNYNFDDLTDSYVPALLNKVLSETGKDKLQYVGFSNGCRATLSSLEKGSFDPNKVETFVGVGCPGAFDGYSTYSYYWNQSADFLRRDLSGKAHLSGEDVGESLRKDCNTVQCYSSARSLRKLGDNLVSFNLANDYLNWVESNSDPQPGADANINRVLIFNGIITGILSDYYDEKRNISHDLVVSVEDGNAIYSNIQADKKYHFESFGLHGGPVLFNLADKSLTKRIVKRFLNNETFNYFDRYYIKEED